MSLLGALLGAIQAAVWGSRYGLLGALGGGIAGMVGGFVAGDLLCESNERVGGKLAVRISRISVPLAVLFAITWAMLLVGLVFLAWVALGGADPIINAFRRARGHD